MRRISTTQDRFEADRNEKIVVTVEAKNTPHDVTFSNDPESPSFNNDQNPPPVEKKSFTMGSADTSFTIVFRFPPPELRAEKPHYLVTFEGKNGTSDGPTKISPLSVVNSVTQLYEFRLAPKATKKAAAGKKNPQ